MGQLDLTTKYLKCDNVSLIRMRFGIFKLHILAFHYRGYFTFTLTTILHFIFLTLDMEIPVVCNKIPFDVLEPCLVYLVKLITC